MPERDDQDDLRERYESAGRLRDREAIRHSREAHAEDRDLVHDPSLPRDHLQRVLHTIGTEPDADFDRLAALAGRLLSTRVSLISLVHEGEAQHFLGESGLAAAGFVGVRGTPIEQSICQGVAATDAPLVLDDTHADARVGSEHPAVRDLGVRAYAGVPLHAEGEAVGALCAIELSPRVWTESEVETLSDLAATAEALLDARLAFKRAQRLAEREHHTSELLQQALLPDALPVLDGASVAAAYRPAETLVGGDWYDVLRLPGGRVAFVLGDVVGHGIEAAAAAGRLRSAYQTGLLEDQAPAAAIAQLNDLADGRDALAYSSVVCGVLDVGTGALEWSSAGHPPPVLVRDGAARLDEPSPDPVLAAYPAGTAFATRTATLAPGDGIVLYSDGLVEERRGVPERYEQLRAVCEAAWDGPDGVVDAALAALRPEPGPDDVALLVIRRD